MEQQKTYKILTLILVMQWAFIQILAQFPNFIETYYSNGIYKYISIFLRSIFGWLPFSIGDVFIVLLLVFIVKNVFRFVKNRKLNFKSAFFKIGAFASVVYFFFYVLWGMNYFRIPIYEKLQLTQLEYTTNDVKNLTEFLITKTNDFQQKITHSDTVKVEIPYTTNEIYEKASNSYNNFTKSTFSTHYKKKSVKSSLISTLQSYMGTGGYLNPFTGEAQVNDLIPKTSIPATSCHEIAHQIGYAAENEANFIGFLTSTNFNDNYFKYSGYKMALRYALRDYYYRDSLAFKAIYPTINKGIIKDFEDHKKFAEKYENPIEPYLWKVYNAYLKANKQKDGVQSYNKMVALLIAYQKEYTKQ